VMNMVLVSLGLSLRIKLLELALLALDIIGVPKLVSDIAPGESILFKVAEQILISLRRDSLRATRLADGAIR